MRARTKAQKMFICHWHGNSAWGRQRRKAPDQIWFRFWSVSVYSMGINLRAAFLCPRPGAVVAMDKFTSSNANCSQVPSAGCRTFSYGLSVQTIARNLLRSRACRASWPARIGLQAADAKWRVALVGTNLTDEAILNNSFPFFNNMSFIQPPRLIWLQATWRFTNK